MCNLRKTFQRITCSPHQSYHRGGREKKKGKALCACTKFVLNAKQAKARFLKTLYLEKNMSRDANLYWLRGKDWKPLAALIMAHKDDRLQKDITIYQQFASSSTSYEYVIITRTEDTDKFIEDYGATVAGEIDSTRNSLHQENRDPLFGDKANLIHLKKLP